MTRGPAAFAFPSSIPGGARPSDFEEIGQYFAVLLGLAPVLRLLLERFNRNPVEQIEAEFFFMR
jgi:hypothetical protein